MLFRRNTDEDIARILARTLEGTATVYTLRCKVGLLHGASILDLISTELGHPVKVARKFVNSRVLQITEYLLALDLFRQLVQASGLH